MKVSFIVPVYNVEKYLVECIESLLNQSEKDFEIVLVDDGSTDASGKICDEYQKKYENIQCIHQENSGVAVARNVGIARSKGKWLFFVDSDDAASRDLIKVCSDFLNDENDICFTGYQEMVGDIIFDKSMSKTYEKRKIVKKDFEEFRLAVFNRDLKGNYDYHKMKMSTPWCKFYRRELLTANEIEFPEGICTGEDALFNLKVYDVANKGYYVSDQLYYHRVWAGAVSKRYDRNAVAHFDELNEAMLSYIKKTGESVELLNAYNERCIWSVGFCCMLDFCSKENPNPFDERKRQFRKMREKYKKQIMQVNLNNFRMQKKILFYFIKKNYFELISVLCYLQGKISLN